jgi:hypothetical protein
VGIASSFGRVTSQNRHYVNSGRVWFSYCDVEPCRGRASIGSSIGSATRSIEMLTLHASLDLASGLVAR